MLYLRPSVFYTNFSRKDFTRHGLHMNSAGKEKLAQAIGLVITNFSIWQTFCISLKWKEVSTATPTKKDTLESSSENADIELKTAVRTSNRTKKIPSTRNEDFFMVNAHSKNNLAEVCNNSGANGECVNYKHNNADSFSNLCSSNKSVVQDTNTIIDMIDNCTNMNCVF
jgi:hypothetical protein